MDRTLGWLVGLFIATLPHSTAAAAPYPDKPIRVIVPVGTGGGLDRIARSVVAKLTDSLGHVIVIDNRPGAGGDIGIEKAVQAPPDGYTLLLVSANYVVRAAMYKVPYDPIGDFAAISQVASVPLLLVVHTSLPAKSVSELVTYAKANSGKLNYSSPGNGSLVHLAGELFKATSKFDMVHVAYKSVDAAFTDLVSGRIQLTFTGILTARPHIKSQRLRALAVTSPQRAKAAPEFPTMIEAGVQNFEATQWHGLLAPKVTPLAIVDLLNREIVKIVRQPELAQRLARDGTEPVGSTRQQFASFIKSDLERWQGVVKRAGIRGD